MTEQTNTLHEVVMQVSKKDPIKKEYVPVGKVSIFVPLLSDLIPAAEQLVDDKGAPVFTDDGLPVYKDDNHNWLQNSIFAQVKAQARNKLVSGTAALKPNVTIATDWAGLTAEGGGNSGEGLAKVREVKALFAKYAASLGKSVNAQTTMNMLFGNKQALSLQTESNRDKIATYVTEFASTLDAAQLERYQVYLESVLEACKAEVAEDF